MFWFRTLFLKTLIKKIISYQNPLRSMENKEMLNNEDELSALKNRTKVTSGSKIQRRQLDYGESGQMVGWLERLANVIHTYGMKTVLQAFLIVIAVVLLLLGVNALDNRNTVDKIIEKTEEIITNKSKTDDDVHTIGTLIRREVTPKINKTIVKMLYELQADRTCILEMHNGKENPTSLPFDFCDMTYEETRGRLPYIADEYEDLNMSKFTFPDYLYTHRVFIGTVEEIYSIDKKLAMRLELNDVKYVGIILIRTNIDIGFLMVSYTSQPPLDRDTIYGELTYYVQEIGTYLDYLKQLENKNKIQ